MNTTTGLHLPKIAPLGLSCRRPCIEETLERLQSLNRRCWAVLDFETASEDHPMVVEVGLVDANGNVLLETLVQPTISVTPFIFGIHGIPDAALVGAPTWPEVQRSMARVLTEAGVDLVLAYNASFERMCLDYNAAAWGIEALDVDLECLQELACGVIGHKPGTEWLSLRTACEQLGIERTYAHRAVADCLVSAHLPKALFRIL